jgi:hypothetical protein
VPFNKKITDESAVAEYPPKKTDSLLLQKTQTYPSAARRRLRAMKPVLKIRYALIEVPTSVSVSIELLQNIAVMLPGDCVTKDTTIALFVLNVAQGKKAVEIPSEELHEIFKDLPKGCEAWSDLLELFPMVTVMDQLLDLPQEFDRS